MGYDYSMSYISDAHTEWHLVNLDRPWDCPLDCGIAEAQADADYYDSLTPEELAELQGSTEQDHVEEDPEYWAHYGVDFDPPF